MMLQSISRRGVLLHDVVRWVKRGSGLAVLLLTAHAAYASCTARLAGDSTGDWRQLAEAALEHGSSASAAVGGHGQEVDQSLESTFGYLILCFFLCCLLDHCNLLIPFNLRFPISVVLFSSGKLFGYIAFKLRDVEALQDVAEGVIGASHMNPHAVFYILLPPLLYESASSLDWYVFKKVVASSVILALPGVLLNIGLTSIFLYFIVDFRSSGTKNINLEASFTLATILSATDPVAVVSALHELGAPKKLAHLIEGESLLNDGSAVVFFFVFLDMLAYQRPDSKKQCNMSDGFPGYHGCVVLYFIRLAAGGVVFGFLVGCVLNEWIKRASRRQSAQLEFTIVLGAVYGTFFLAEVLHVSGVLAVVVLGVMMTAQIYPRLSQDGRHLHHNVLAEIGYVCNMCIFFTAGIISTRFMFMETDRGGEEIFKKPRVWGELFGVYVWIHVTRSLVAFFFLPALRRLGYGLKWKEAAILVYGGLRGAVGLAMGLLVEHDQYVDRDVSAVIAFHTSGIVLLTLCINGSTIDELYRKLQPYPPNPFRMNHIRKVLCTVEEECRKVGLRELYRHWFFKDAEFKRILKCVPHFGHIHFENGIAHPTGIHKVSHTLRSLTQHAQTAVVAEKAARSGSQEPSQSSGFASFFRSHTMGAELKRSCVDFEKTWGEHKKDLQHKCKLWLLHSVSAKRTNQAASGKQTIYNDQLLSIDSLGDKELGYDGSGHMGFYVSVLPLDHVTMGKDHFSVKLLRTESVSVLIGFFVDHEGVRTLSEHCGPQLGTAMGTVAFDCSNSTITRTGLGQGGHIEDHASCGALPAGMTILVSVKPGSVRGSYSVIFEAVEESCADPEKAEFDDPQMLGEIDIGAVHLEDMHPVIEVRPCQKTRRAFDKLRQQRTGCIEPEALSRKGTAISIAEAIGLDKSKTSGTTVPSIGNLVSGMSFDSGSVLSSGDAKKVFAANLRLSFVPQIASDNESLSETFQVLFNAVLHHYLVMHDNGILSTSALMSVSEAVSKAMDCMNREMNAINVTRFRDMSQIAVSRTNSQMSEVTNDGRCEIHRMASVESFFQEKKQRVSFKAEKATTRNSGCSSLSAALHEIREKNGGIAILEPLVVEYLALEQNCSKKSFWERFPDSWTWLRQFGYSSTRNKIESLWAFVEAHETVLRDFPSLKQRCPELVACLKDVIAEAKNDLKILAELRPRRFYFCKHFLVLRFVMCRRLDRLKRFITQGWISHSDAEGLIHALRDRIVQVEQFFPSTISFNHNGGGDGPRFLRSSTMGDLDDQYTAWSDEDLRLDNPKMDKLKSGLSARSLDSSAPVLKQNRGTVFGAFIRSMTRASAMVNSSMSLGSARGDAAVSRQKTLNEFKDRQDAELNGGHNSSDMTDVVPTGRRTHFQPVEHFQSVEEEDEVTEIIPMSPGEACEMPGLPGDVKAELQIVEEDGLQAVDM